MKSIIKEMRIDHYIKNMVIFIPFILNSELSTTINLMRAFFLFISFCFISSTVYVLNDLKDKEKDALDPYKKMRPIAQGLISTNHALIMAMLCFVISISISIYLNSYLFILCYLFLNIAYSLCFKNIFFIDAVCIALGFILRVLSSYHLLKLPVNFEVILFVFFTSAFFTFTKRKLELTSSNHRKSLKDVSKNQINISALMSAWLSLFFFIIIFLHYTDLEALGLLTLLYSTILVRFLILSNNPNSFTDPINFIKKDLFLKVLLLMFFGSLYYAIIFHF